MTEFFGKGLYTTAEASRLLRIPVGKITRWLRGHKVGEKYYDALWHPEVRLGDDRIFLSFRDLMEIRVANAFIKLGLAPVRVRSAIKMATEITGRDRPLSSNKFRTDGRDIFFSIIETNEIGEAKEKLLNLFRSQYEFKIIIDPILKSVDFDDFGSPTVWWPEGRQVRVLVDPERSFGKPIDVASSVPTFILAECAKLEGIIGAASAFEVPESSIRRAIDFESKLDLRIAA